MHYDIRLRPAQPAAPAPDAFTIHRAEVAPSPGRDGLTLSYVHEDEKDGAGYPVLLLHGYPETKRIWWRNIAALAEAGYEVIAPDLRGHGDSDLSQDDVYDIAAYSRDVDPAPGTPCSGNALTCSMPWSSRFLGTYGCVTSVWAEPRRPLSANTQRPTLEC